MNYTQKNVVMWINTKGNLFEDPPGPKRETYQEFFTKISHVYNFFIVFGADAYEGDGKFKNLFQYVSNELKECPDQVTADVIYNYSNIPKIGFDPGPAIITNTPEFKQFCKSKYETYQYLKEFSPATVYIDKISDLSDALNKVNGNTVVIKPVSGSNGRDVMILDRDKVSSEKRVSEIVDDGIIIQEFLNTKDGLPGIADSYHDLRIITINEKVCLVHIRIPESGSMVANTHRGAIMKELVFEQLPEDIQNFYKEVHDKIIKKFYRPLLSMDIAYTDKGPKLIELNAHTAFPMPYFKCKDDFIDNLIEHFSNIGQAHK